MPIPDYQQSFLPILHILADGTPKHRRVIMSEVADHFELTEAERSKLLPSGKNLVILSRVGWALAYLKQARLVESPKRGLYQLTDRGRETLLESPPSLNVAYLERFQEFRDFQERARVSAEPNPPRDEPAPPETPGPLTLTGGSPRDSLRQPPGWGRG